MRAKIYAMCMLAMVTFVSCKNEPKAAEQTVKEEVKENTIKLSNYSDNNWNAGVAIELTMFLADNNAENKEKLKAVKELKLSDGTYVAVTGTKEEGPFIQILLLEKASNFQKFAEYPNDITVK